MSSEQFILQVTDEAGERIDAYLAARIPDLTRMAIGRLIDDGLITIAGESVKAKYKVKPGDEITVEVPPPAETDIAAQEIPIDILYEDDDIAVVFKPRGMTTHPAPGSPDNTLVNALLAKITNLSGVGGVKRPGIVHRLDKDTSGLLVVAKNDSAHLNLQEQIKARTAGRKYFAILWGDTKFEKAVVNAPMGRHQSHRQKMAVIADGPSVREAVTELTVLEHLNGFTFIEASLQTGRTHQIRVHCSYIGHPVVGDPLYGGRRRELAGRLGPKSRQEFETLLAALNGQALHAHSLTFDHPRTGEKMSFDVPMPGVMIELLEWVRQQAG